MCVGKAIARFCPIYKRFNKNSFRSETVFIIDYHSFHCNIFPFSDFSCQTVFQHSVFTSVYIAKLRYEIGNSSPAPGRPGFGRFPVSPGPAPGFRPPCPAAYCSSARSWGCRPDSVCRGTSPTCRIVYSSCLLSGKFLLLNTSRVYDSILPERHVSCIFTLPSYSTNRISIDTTAFFAEENEKGGMYVPPIAHIP